jgi:hypothetical protein
MVFAEHERDWMECKLTLSLLCKGFSRALDIMVMDKETFISVISCWLLSGPNFLYWKWLVLGCVLAEQHSGSGLLGIEKQWLWEFLRKAKHTEKEAKWTSKPQKIQNFPASILHFPAETTFWSKFFYITIVVKISHENSAEKFRFLTICGLIRLKKLI